MSKTIQNIKPRVGMGVTKGVGSDRYPYTIIGVSTSGKVLEIQADDYHPTAKHDYYNGQDYEYTPDETGEVLFISLRKDGRWRQIGIPSSRGVSTFSIGHREAYSDPSF